VLREDYLEVPEERIKKITFNLTLLGGRIVHATRRFEDLA
jgi:predicted amidohydrolase YtcJ